MKKANPAEVKKTIGYEELEKVDVRVGTIEQVVDIEKSDKLVRLVVNFGDHKRNIVVGMKQERKDPMEVLGKQALFVVNLEPREIMGEISQGMLFDLGFKDKIIPALAVPERKVPDGTRAG